MVIFNVTLFFNFVNKKYPLIKGGVIASLLLNLHIYCIHKVSVLYPLI
nr:MAG TPA: hypothetical protein [Caudoviricetes sp.]